jgi:hypothetical protein
MKNFEHRPRGNEANDPQKNAKNKLEDVGHGRRGSTAPRFMSRFRVMSSIQISMEPPNVIEDQVTYPIDRPACRAKREGGTRPDHVRRLLPPLDRPHLHPGTAVYELADGRHGAHDDDPADAARERRRSDNSGVLVRHVDGTAGRLHRHLSDEQASQRPSTSWKRRCFVASENDRAAVHRNTDRSIPSFTATLRVTENFQSRAIAQEALRLKMVGEILVWRAARDETDVVTLGPTR